MVWEKLHEVQEKEVLPPLWPKEEKLQALSRAVGQPAQEQLCKKLLLSPGSLEDHEPATCPCRPTASWLVANKLKEINFPLCLSQLKYVWSAVSCARSQYKTLIIGSKASKGWSKQTGTDGEKRVCLVERRLFNYIEGKQRGRLFSEVHHERTTRCCKKRISKYVSETKTTTTKKLHCEWSNT